MSVIEVDYDQADWGCLGINGTGELYGDGELPGLWVPYKGIGHWGGGTVPPTLHSGCLRLIRGWDRYHTHTKGWRCIAYNYLFCNHGATFRGRGWNPSGATSGDWEKDGIRENAEGVAIAHLGGSGGSISKRGWEAAGDLWRQVHAAIGAGATDYVEVGIGHRDVKSTSCPGDAYYRWIHNQGWKEAPPPPPPTTLEDDMLPLYFGDGVKNGTTLTHPVSGRDFVTKRQHKASDVAALQGVLRRAAATAPMAHGVYDEAMAFALTQVTPDTAGDGMAIGGDDWDPIFFAAYGGDGGANLSFIVDGDTVTLSKQ